MSEFALWRRLDVPGHDAALLTRRDSGWSLRGAAIFKHRDGPACINYLVDVDASWRTERGRVQGFLAGRSLDHIINRQPDGWHLDGVLIRGDDLPGEVSAISISPRRKSRSKIW